MSKDSKILVKLVDSSAVLRRGERQTVWIDGTKVKSAVNEGWVNDCIRAGILEIVPETDEVKKIISVDDGNKEGKEDKK